MTGDEAAPERPRIAPRVRRTSDESRVRPMLVGAAVAAVAAIAVLAVGPEARAPGPLSLPHERATLGCAACHGDTGAKASCARCHGGHTSTRAGHRALAARGEIACTTCHAAHGGEGVTFEGERRFVLWGPGGNVAGTASLDGIAGATVPLVRAQACGGCHRLEDPRDPISACVHGSVVTCFDEHQRAGGTSDRFVAWEAAREVAERPRAVLASSVAPFGWAGAALGIGAIALAALARRPRPAALAPPPPPAARVRLPMIDPGTCLGCSACVDACPFDVLAIDRFVAVVARPAECCGAVLCADACPNGSLQIADGELAPERPRVDARLESLDANGVFLAGDLTGLPLIRNAIRQGAAVAERVAGAGRARHPELDLVVVGAGPAGLSAMLRAEELGLRAVCLEQWTFAASIRSFPREKVVFDVPGADPLEGPLWMREATKEELVAQWTRTVRARGIDVREHRRVTDVARDDAGFVVTAVGEGGAEERVRAGRVVLAIGRRGTPRMLPATIAPGAEGKVSYALADARSFAGKRVLVVGLGDAAIEAAIALAHQPGTSVTISYRGASVTRGKQRNVTELRALALRGRVKLVFESALERVDRGTATLLARGETREIPNDAVLVLVGGVPSWELVARAGVRLARESAASAPDLHAKTLSPVCP